MPLMELYEVCKHGRFKNCECFAEKPKPEYEVNDKLEPVYSNFDHTYNKAVVALLRAHPRMASDHTAWDFHGTVWFDGVKWHEHVYCYHSLVAKYEGDTLEEVIEAAIDNHGRE